MYHRHAFQFPSGRETHKVNLRPRKWRCRSVNARRSLTGVNSSTVAPQDTNEQITISAEVPHGGIHALGSYRSSLVVVAAVARE